MNKDAISFNNKLNKTSQNLKSKLPGIKLVVFDIFQPLFDMITKPAESGNMLKLFPLLLFLAFSQTRLPFKSFAKHRHEQKFIVKEKSCLSS